MASKPRPVPRSRSRSRWLDQDAAKPGHDHDSDDDAAVLRKWENDVERAARWGARLMGGGPDDADDLAQAARLSVIRAQHRGRGEVHYLRRAIRNAVITGVRRERLAITTNSPRGGSLDACRKSPSINHDVPVSSVREWVSMLPERLRQVYGLLYEKGLTQRQAAVVLGVSQPSIARLHHVLLRRGRLELTDVAA